jgi:hypothetical protein
VYLTFVTESEPSAKDRLIGKDYKRRSVYFTFVMESELVAIKLLNAINTATKCKVMLPSSATECCHLRRSPKGVQSLIDVEGGRRRNRGSIRAWPKSGAGE